MKRLAELRDLIPAIVTLAFIVSVAGLVLEVTVATLKGTPTDAVAMGTFGGLASAALAVLVPLYLKESAPPPSPPDDPPQRSSSRPPRRTYVEESSDGADVVPTGDEESDEWNRRHGYLETRGRGRWTRWA